MEQAKHTPGPWKVEVWSNDGEIAPRCSIVSLTAASDIGPEAILNGVQWYDSPRECANAHLIAAAPDLLQELQKARIQLHRYYIGTVSASEQRSIEIGLDRIDAAIAKAEGK